MKVARPLSLAVIVLGAALLGVAYHFSEAPMAQLSSVPAAHHSDNTMRYIAALFGRRI